MKRTQLNVVKALGVLAGGLVVIGCSPDQSDPVRAPSARLKAATVATLQTVPDDATEFQARVTVDPSGNILSRSVVLGGATVAAGFDRSALPSKPEAEAATAPVPPEKISPTLAAMVSSSSAASTEVVVAVAHDAQFSPLIKLLRDQPLTSAENVQRFATRASQIAAVDTLRKPSRAAVISRARALGAVVTEEYAMGNAVTMTIPNAALASLAKDPAVISIGPRYDGSVPPATISNGTSLATGMNSDYWRPISAGNLASLSIVTFDTGVRSSHTLFNSPDGGALGQHRDCSHGNSSCLNSPVNPLYNDQDPDWSHGTGVASIIMGGNSSSTGFGLSSRGVSRVALDYLNIYTAGGLDTAAVLRAWNLVPGFGDDVVVGELQSGDTDAGAISLAADDAFDLGIAVVAACGNGGAVTAPAAFGNAHKALSIGDYDAITGTSNFQVPGLVDGRIKPDVQTPTTVDAASSRSDTGKVLGFNGTSGATAFAGGASAVMYHWYNSAFGLSNRPGNFYTALLAQGDAPTQPTIPNGAGRLKLVSGADWATGSVSVGTSAVEITFAVPAGRENLHVAIWWPERQSDAHNDVDLQVLDPAGGSVGLSQWAGSVWEKVTQTGALAEGTYRIRFIPFSMPRSTQVVYYTAITSHASAPANPCADFCSPPSVFNWSGSYQSGQLGTGTICRETTQAVVGGNCGNLAPGRTLSVNGSVMPCNNLNWSSIPAPVNGGYCVTTTAGQYPWAFFTLW